MLPFLLSAGLVQAHRFLTLRRLRIFHEEAKQPLVVIKVCHGRVSQDLVPDVLSDSFEWISVDVSQLVKHVRQ